MNLRDFTHILNPNRKNRSAVRRFFKNNPQLQYIWVERTSHPTHLETIVEWALMEGKEALAIWGGDGTLNRVVQMLYVKGALKKVQLALIPVGTCNDFWHKIGGLGWRRWLHQLQKEDLDAKYYDLGVMEHEAGRRVFVNNAGFGRTREALLRMKSKPVQDIWDLTEKRLQIEWTNGKIQHYETVRACLGMVFNSPYFNRRLFFDSQINPQDGLLRTCFVPAGGRLALMGRFFWGRLGRSLKRKRDLEFEAESVGVHSEDLLFPQVDGETVSFEGVKNIQFSLIPSALALFTPQGLT